jgi:hypothetical protein
VTNVANFMLLAQADPNNGAAAGGGAFLGGLLAFGAVFWIIAIAATVFWIWAMIDVVTSNKEPTEKILWFLVIFFLHIVGALVYLAVGRSRRGAVAT